MQCPGRRKYNATYTNDNTGAPSACGCSTTVTWTHTSSCAPFSATCSATYTVASPAAIGQSCRKDGGYASCNAQADENTTQRTPMTIQARPLLAAAQQR